MKKAQAANVTDGSVKALSQKITVAEAVVKDVKGKRCTSRNDESYIRVYDFTLLKKA